MNLGFTLPNTTSRTKIGGGLN